MKIITILVLLCFVWCAESQEQPKARVITEWIPTAHQTNMAYYLVENFCRFSLSDDRKIADGDVNKQFYGYTPFISEDFKVGNLTYTNYIIHCAAFSIPVGRGYLRYIAVQHFLPSDTRTATGKEAQAFTVYYGVDSGHVGLDLGTVLFYVSHHLPYQVKGYIYRQKGELSAE